jgi:hypothetical protein
MKSMKPCLALAIALLCSAGAKAAEMDKANVIRSFTDTVAPADQEAYEAGVKSYNQCLSQHGSKYAWTALVHETGDTYQYSYVSSPVTWAAFDAMRAANKACDQTWRTAANPHLKGETSAFMVQRPDLSHMSGDMALTSPLLEVRFFKLKQGHEASEAFTNVAKQIAAAAEKTHWSAHYMFGEVQDSGEDAPDFILLIPAKNWADFGADPNPTVWKMVENAYGKPTADSLRKSLNDSIQSDSSHIDSYSAELTYMPAHK